MNVTDNRIEADGAMSSKPPAMTKAMVIVLLAVAVIMGGIFGWQRFIGKMIGKSISGQASIPQKVSTIVAAASVWQSRTQALGTVRAVRGADLAAQASGVVDTIHIESGTKVGAGAVLLTLKPNDDPAKLAQLRAQAELAAVTLKRDQEQLAAEAVSQATVDADSANLKSARAQVAAQEALIEEKTVRAPFAGTPGRSPGRRGAVSRRGDHGGHAAGARSGLHRFLRAAAGAEPPEGGPDGGRRGRCLPAGGLSRHDHVDQFEGGLVEPQRTSPGAPSAIRTGASFPACTPTSRSTTAAPPPSSRCRHRPIIYNPYGDTVYVVQRPAPTRTTRRSPSSSVS